MNDIDTRRNDQSYASFVTLDRDSSSAHDPLQLPPTATTSNIISDSLVLRERDQIVYPTSKSSLWQQYASLPYQHPIRFLGLCTQVFIYYLGYGYLQVSFGQLRQLISFRANFFKELLFTLDGFGDTAWFLSCYQFLIYGLLSFSQIGLAGFKQRRWQITAQLRSH